MTNQGSQQWFVIVSQDSNIGAKKLKEPSHSPQPRSCPPLKTPAAAVYPPRGELHSASDHSEDQRQASLIGGWATLYTPNIWHYNLYVDSSIDLHAVIMWCSLMFDIRAWKNYDMVNWDHHLNPICCMGGTWNICEAPVSVKGTCRMLEGVRLH